ncbi:Gfo/Idh/MocA family protein [Aureibacillus halotolerans]|uniref:Putative dehydrogenase n=1 Tax=Aureibacillus halotolerans TaxID=1508390 RepID=A0A4R6U8K3_9BACI|nr:Gfo/Idh/MocA family oxidoreductase [Aureibacillus halotolerans]TDQ41119.1 putative dehydrogenase [Aureibacillus halotolerans]
MRLGIIGTNWITEEFVAAAHASGKWTLNAVYSRNHERAKTFAEPFHVTDIYTNIEAMAQSDDIDAVYIASPNSLHFEQAIAFLKEKKHVIVEKPVFSTLDEFDRAHTIANEHGVYLLEAARHMFEPNFKELQQHVSRVGDIHSAFFVFAKYSSRYDQVLEGEEPNIFSLNFSGGSLVDLGVYPLYTAVALFGVPRSATYNPQIISTGVDGGGPIVLQYEGFSVTIFQAKNSNSFLHNEIHGVNGTLKFDNIAGIEEIQWLDNRSADPIELAVRSSEENKMQFEAEAFANLIEKNDRETYEVLTSLSRNVLSLMCQLRHDNGLYFAVEQQH